MHRILSTAVDHSLSQRETEKRLPSSSTTQPSVDCPTMDANRGDWLRARFARRHGSDDEDESSTSSNGGPGPTHTPSGALIAHGDATARSHNRASSPNPGAFLYIPRYRRKTYQQPNGLFDTTQQTAMSRLLLESNMRMAERQAPRAISESECLPTRHYAQWASGYIEVNSELLGRHICPADLAGLPCLFDEFNTSCPLIRLCHQLKKWTEHMCGDADFRDQGEFCTGIELSCRHIHWEVEKNCRFVARGKNCVIVLEKGYDCACGHDFEEERRASRLRLRQHRQQAINLGAREQVQHNVIW